MDGVPTLMLRVANERSSQIVEAQARLTIVRTEQTLEDQRFYRVYDLSLLRERQPNFARAWVIRHRLDEKSPLFGATPESLKTSETEFTLSIMGTDEVSSQTMHARTRYIDSQIVWGARFVDLLSDLPDGRLRLDMTRFDDIEPTAPTAAFAYPRR